MPLCAFYNKPCCKSLEFFKKELEILEFYFVISTKLWSYGVGIIWFQIENV